MSDEFSEFVQWFRSAAPYIHAHRGKTFILQFDGDLIESDEFSKLLHDLALLNSVGIRLVIVFGADPQIEKLQQQAGISSRYINGVRQTEKSSIEYVKQAIGATMMQIEAILSMGVVNSPMQYAQLKVISGNFVTACPIGIIDGIDLGLTGVVRCIDNKTITDKLNNNEIVLIPPLGYSLTGEIFTLSATELAMEIATCLMADKLIYLLPDAVIKGKDEQGIRQLTPAEARQIIDAENLQKTAHLALFSGLHACKAGVRRVHFIQQHTDGSLLMELFTRDGVGTLLSTEPFDQIRVATISDVGGILALIQPFEQQGVLAYRSREKIETDINDYTVLVRDGSVIACAALHIEGNSRYAELACLVVDRQYHNLGNGGALLRNIQQQAHKKGIEKIFVLTTQTSHWFIERGFTEIAVNELPLPRQTLYNYHRNAKVLSCSIP